MKTPTNQLRRRTLQHLGALAGGLAAPAMAFGGNASSGDTTSVKSGAEQTNSEQSETEQASAAEPELEKYGIREFQAPEIRLDYWIDANGEPTEFSVKQQEGKWLFMKFFQNWCPGCHRSGFPTLQKFVAAFEGNPNVASVAVQTVFEGFSHNSQDAVRELQLRYKLPIVMGHDPGTKLTDNLPLSMINYRTGGTPWLVLVAPNGQVVMNQFHVDPDTLIEFVQQAIA